MKTYCFHCCGVVTISRYRFVGNKAQRKIVYFMGPAHSGYCRSKSKYVGTCMLFPLTSTISGITSNTGTDESKQITRIVFVCRQWKFKENLDSF